MPRTIVTKRDAKAAAQATRDLIVRVLRRDISGLDLKGADLRGINFRHVDLYEADLRGATGLTPEQRAYAKSRGAIVDD